MTKNSNTEPPLHVGVRLHFAYESWLALFIQAMQRDGHDWFTHGRANLMGTMDRDGTRQSELLQRSGLSKQALQQMLDGLERHGVLTRTVDKHDKRGRWIELTAKGHAALVDADRIKQEISVTYERKLGAESLARLEALLDQLAEG